MEDGTEAGGGESEVGDELEADGESPVLEVNLCCEPGEALDEVTGSCTPLASGSVLKMQFIQYKI
jgi:hypothetical protein